jgi:GTPase SAR1 family protein
MKLTTPQEKVFQILKTEIKEIEGSVSNWGIALIGPDGFGKTSVIRKIREELSDENLVFAYLDLCIPDICPEGKNVNWEEYFKQIKDMLPEIVFSDLEEIRSLSEKMERLSSICRKNKKRIFIILDHLEECKDWRVARWPIENRVADVVLVSSADAWEEKESDRVATSFFIKKVYLDKPIDFVKDKEIFFEVVSNRFNITKKAMEELFESMNQKASKGKMPSWFDIFREADEMEEIGE